MKKDISISEAARLSGVSRQTIYNQIDSGELSRNVKKRIDISELLRVYPDISLDITEVTPKNKSVQNEVSSGVLGVDTSALQVEIKYLKKEVESLENIIKSKNEQIDTLTKQVDKLMSMNEKLQVYALPDPKNKKTWQFWK